MIFLFPCSFISFLLAIQRELQLLRKFIIIQSEIDFGRFSDKTKANKQGGDDEDM